MAPRSLGSRLVVGSAMWTLGLLVGATLVAGVVVRHAPWMSGRMHWTVLGFGAAILMVAGLAQLQRSLTPFAELRRRLQAVRDGEATQVDGVYPSEVQPVVSDLNALLTHQATAVTRAQAKAGDLAHGLKTPLAVLSQEAERLAALGQSDLAEAIQQQVARMQRHITYHLTQARAAASGATLNAQASVRESVEGLVRVLDRVYTERGLVFDIAVEPGHTVRVQRVDLDEMLGNLLDNACKWARTRVRITSSHADGRVVISVDDDGPGVARELRAAVLQRGVRADESALGTGLGLAIVRDLVDLYGGAIALRESPLGGLRVDLSLANVATDVEPG